MRRRRGWLLTLGIVGLASLVHVFVVRGFLEPATGPSVGLAWPLFGVLPLWIFGIWLLTASSSRMAVYVALGATGSAVGLSFETLVTSTEVSGSSGYPLLNQVGLLASAIGSVGFLLVLAAFPDGTTEDRWQRVTVRLLWATVLAVPLTLLTSRYVVPPDYTGVSQAIPNPYAVPSLEWAAPVVTELAVRPWIPLVIGVGVFASRILLGGPELRRKLQVMGWTMGALMVLYPLSLAVPAWGLADTPLMWLVQAAVLGVMVALPVACIHGILRYGAFDVATADRDQLVVRSSSTLIAMFYGIAVAGPALLALRLFPGSLAPVSAVILAAATAFALLPLRGRLDGMLRRAVLGDRDRQLTLLHDLGRQLEQSPEPDDLLTRLAQAVYEALDATWVRVRLTDEAGDPVDSPIGVAGSPTGDPIVSHLLSEDGTTIGLLEVGPRRRGAYSTTERDVLRTVAGQATTAVANVRLSAQLRDQLAELTSSRAQLIAAQDDERRRIERDLHDGVQQNVVALIAGLRLARNRVLRGELSADDLSELQDQARDTLSDLRDVVHGIQPPVLSDKGLMAAVESGVVRYPIPLSVEADEAVRNQRFPAAIEATAYYVVREALTNTAKHADATAARVELARANGHLRVTVSDNGHGFVPDARATSGGLANMRNRVTAVHGTIRLGRNTPSGTIVTVELPASAAPADR